MLPDKPLLTVVIPVFDEEDCIEALGARLLALRERMQPEAAVEFLFVDDGSRDRSALMLEALAARHPFMKYLSLSRNFGHQLAVTAGLDHAREGWVAIIDGDLQDPPEAIADMFRRAREGEGAGLGYDVVYGQRLSRKGESAFKRASAAFFYRMLNRLCDIEIPPDTGDFRVLSWRVVESLRGMRERHRYLRGMVPWIGFSSVAHRYERDPRHAGVTKYPLRKMLQFAANAVLSFTAKPLALATRLGALAVLCGVAGAVYMLYLKLFTDIPVPGVTSILVTIVFFSGVQVMLIGILGAYVARIFEEAKGRPLYVIAKSRNL
jgi:glycosyltransferase involved in cell wall biosynthesis